MIHATSSPSTTLRSTTFLSQPSMPPGGRRLAPTSSSGPERPVVLPCRVKTSICPGSRSGGRSTTTMSSWITTHSTAHGTHARTLLIRLSKGTISCVSSTPPPARAMHGVVSWSRRLAAWPPPPCMLQELYFLNSFFFFSFVVLLAGRIVLILGAATATAVPVRASIEWVACFLTSGVPEEVRVGRGVVSVPGVGRDGLLVGVLRAGEVVPRLPQKGSVPAQRLRVCRLSAHSPLEVVLRPAKR